MDRRALFQFGVLALCLAATGASVVQAAFGDPSVSTSNVFTADTLDPPTGLSANVSGTAANLAWTATPDTYAAGHRVLRGTVPGGPYTQIAQIAPRTTVTYVDSPGGGTFYYVVRAYFQSWESVDSNEASATVSTTTNTGFMGCGANAAVTILSGDNDGFQLNPGNACANDAAFAEDTDGGILNSTACNSTARDRHLYYDYGLSIPAGASLKGIEVRLDAWSDGNGGTPQICVELSWDGGATWTTAKTTGLTTTEATYLLGSTTDTWGRTWSDGEFSNANLRMRLTTVANSTSRDFRLDWVAVRVSYVP